MDKLLGIVEVLQQRLTEQKKTLALAESITGGRLAATLTSRAGASQYFLGSLVTYTDGMKTGLLGVSDGILQSYGAVSEEVASLMLQGVFRVTTADYGLSVTGIAGPTGSTAELSIGTVWCAVGARGSVPFIRKIMCEGRTREEIIMETVERSLEALLTYVEGV